MGRATQSAGCAIRSAARQWAIPHPALRAAFPSKALLNRRQTDQLAIWVRDGQQGGLVIAPHSIKRVVEPPLAALAVQNHLFAPVPKKDRALLRKIVDHGLHKGIMQLSAVIGAELGHYPAGSLLPIGDQTPCG